MVDKDVEINKKEKILLICNTQGYTISIEKKRRGFFFSRFLSLEYPTPKKGCTTSFFGSSLTSDIYFNVSLILNHIVIE
jgi:hypothetical protein